MGEVFIEAAISPRSTESEFWSCCTKQGNEDEIKPKDQIRKDKFKKEKMGAPRYPGTGSSFSIRPLTPEKPKTVTAISTINPTKEKVTS